MTKKKVTLAVLLSVAALLSFGGTASGVAPGRTVEYAGGGAGKVVFDGDSHKSLTCMECHTRIFSRMTKNAPRAKITMKDIYEGKYCGACHNGTRAFDAKKTDNCSKCHRK